MTSPVTVLVYSDNSTIRRRVIGALGKRPKPDLPEFAYLEVATMGMLLRRMDCGGIDVAILDGEATPAGGMGIARQLKDELDHCPPLTVLIGRPVDSWLARWSHADVAIPYPLEPALLTDAIVGLLSTSAASTTR
jgi:DNA-binding response OmpR family regulator